jgi:hypothetical protein
MARHTWLWVVLLTLSLTSASAQSGREETVEALLAESSRLSDEGRYLEAQQFARSALEQARAFGPDTMRFGDTTNQLGVVDHALGPIPVGRSYCGTRQKLTLHSSRGLANTLAPARIPRITLPLEARMGAPSPASSSCSCAANWVGIAPRSCEEECRSRRLDSGVSPRSTRAGQLLTPFLAVIP